MDPHPRAPAAFIVTRCRYAWPDARRAIEIAVGAESISPDALARLCTPAGTPRYPPEWSRYTTPLAAVQAAIRLQTALRHTGHGYWPLRISGADLPAHAALQPRRARRWALRYGRNPTPPYL